MLETTSDLFTLTEQSKRCFSSQLSVQCLLGPYSSFFFFLSHHCLHPFLLPSAAPNQVQHWRSTRLNKCDWVGRDVEVKGSEERDVEEGARWVEARREG